MWLSVSELNSLFSLTLCCPQLVLRVLVPVAASPCPNTQALHLHSDIITSLSSKVRSRNAKLCCDTVDFFRCVSLLCLCKHGFHLDKICLSSVQVLSWCTVRILRTEWVWVVLFLLFFQWVLNVFRRGGGKELDFLMKMREENDFEVCLFLSTVFTLFWWC